MRHAIVLASILAMAVVGLLLAGTATADNFSLGITTGNVNLGINISQPPKLVPVPGTPVYRAPAVTYNYFSYENRYYLYHNDGWYYSVQYNGPWIAISLQQVPPPILTVPVEYYPVPPGHWKDRHGPPPWAGAKGYEKEKRHKKKERDHDDDDD